MALVVVRGPLPSFCPRPLAAYGTATVAYFGQARGFRPPGDLVAPRQRRLTPQERACNDVVDALIEHLAGQVMRGRHRLSIPDRRWVEPTAARRRGGLDLQAQLREYLANLGRFDRSTGRRRRLVAARPWQAEVAASPTLQPRPRADIGAARIAACRPEHPCRWLFPALREMNSKCSSAWLRDGTQTCARARQHRLRRPAASPAGSVRAERAACITTPAAAHLRGPDEPRQCSPPPAIEIVALNTVNASPCRAAGLDRAPEDRAFEQAPRRASPGQGPGARDPRGRHTDQPGQYAERAGVERADAPGPACRLAGGAGSTRERPCPHRCPRPWRRCRCAFLPGRCCCSTQFEPRYVLVDHAPAPSACCCCGRIGQRSFRNRRSAFHLRMPDGRRLIRLEGLGRAQLVCASCR